MLCCYHDPGMALFLSEMPLEDDQQADAGPWIALVAAVLLSGIGLMLLL